MTAHWRQELAARIDENMLLRARLQEAEAQTRDLAHDLTQARAQVEVLTQENRILKAANKSLRGRRRNY